MYLQFKNQAPLIERVVELGKSYLKDSGKTRDAAAILVSRVLTRFVECKFLNDVFRPDCSKYLSDFLAWGDQVLSSSSQDTFLVGS